MKGQTITVSANGYANTGVFKINYINGIASGDNLDVLVTDTAGNPVFVWNFAIANERSFGLNLGGQAVNGIRVSRFDNCETLVIGVEKVSE